MSDLNIMIDATTENLIPVMDVLKLVPTSIANITLFGVER